MTKNKARTRLDTLVADRLNISRTRAQALIMEGKVRVDGERRIKPGQPTDSTVALGFEQQAKYVGRGGLKLERALDAFGWSVKSLRCLDVGASTGGFTDCLLQRGAADVSAIDVGYGQLAWPLRNDPRVTVIERANFRYADIEAIGGPFDFVCADVSFISLRALAPKLREALKDSSRIIVLIKPQFEAGRGANKRGVVRSPSAQVAAIRSVIEAFEANDLAVENLVYSPVAGPAGNLEFLLGARRAFSGVARIAITKREAMTTAKIQSVVDEAHDKVPRRNGSRNEIR